MKFETEQDLFNHIVAHAASMDGPSLGKGSLGRCQYRGYNGSMCLVGACISNEEYSPEMEGCNVYALSRNGLLPSGLEKYRNLLSICQKSHDNEAKLYLAHQEMGRLWPSRGSSQEQLKDRFSAELLEKLRIVAKKFNLDFVLPNNGDK